MTTDDKILRLEEKLLEFVDTSMPPQAVLEHLLSKKKDAEPLEKYIQSLDPKMAFMARQILKQWTEKLSNALND